MNLKFPAFLTILHLQFISSDATVLGGVIFSVCRKEKRLMDLPCWSADPGRALSSFRPQVWSLTHTLTCWASVAGVEAGVLRTEGQPKIVLKSDTQNVKSIILLQIYSKHEPKIYLSH